jgi:hypothetical protein
MKVASSVIVDLYRIAYNAGRAVTFNELVDGLPSAYQNDANRWWVRKEEEAGRITPPDPWPASMLRSVKIEWAAEYIRSSVHTQRLSVNARDGRARTAGLHREELVYSANKDKPPKVSVEVLKTETVDWTPEVGATGRRHVAGIKFREAMAGMDPDKATKAQLVEVLKLAAEALAHGPS